MATGILQNGKWKWQLVNWHQEKDGLWRSNRIIPSQWWYDKKWTPSTSNIKAGAIVIKIINKEPHILMVEVYNDLIGFPKGSKEINESTVECAMRELHEETGLKLDLTKQKTVEINNNGKSFVFYLITVDEKTNLDEHPKGDIEISAYGWINISKVWNYKLSGVTKKN